MHDKRKVTGQCGHTGMSWLRIGLNKICSREKTSLIKHLVVALKRNVQTLNHFSRLFSIFLDISRSGQIALEIQDFFKNSRL